MKCSTLISASVVLLSHSTIAQQSQQQPISDPGTYNSESLEIVHLYYDEWPTGTTHAEPPAMPY